MPSARCRHCGGDEWVDNGDPDDIGRCSACKEFPTLGHVVVAWIPSHCVVPDRAARGGPFRPTNEQAYFVLRHYRIDPWTGRFFYERGSQLTRPQKHGKGPLVASVVCAEAEGPVLFADFAKGGETTPWGYVYKPGEPIGENWATPHIQITACSEAQTANTWRALQPMIELGPLGALMIPDTGLSRINLRGGGLIEPVTSGARSRLGNPITFAAQDETHAWIQSNHGWELADNQHRNLAGMGGRRVETTNAYDPAQNSVAQRTQGEPGVYLDDVDGGPGSIRNKAERRKVMRKVYGDSLKDRGGWVDLDRIDVEIEAKLEHDPAQAERFFLNRKFASEGAAFDIEAWKALAEPRKVPQGAVVVIGVDGARHEDALGIIATEVKTGYQWPLDIIERPEDAGDDYEHDQDRADAAVDDAFDTYNVWRVYCDDQKIEGLVEKWQNRYGEKRVQVWLTYRPRPIAWAVRKYEGAIAAGDVTHDGNDVFERHIRNARRRMVAVLDDKERQMHTIAKDHRKSPRKMDAAMAGVLSWEARGDCIAAGVVWMGDQPEPSKPQESTQWVPGTALPASAMTRGEEVGPMGTMG